MCISRLGAMWLRCSHVHADAQRSEPPAAASAPALPSRSARPSLPLSICALEHLTALPSSCAAGWTWCSASMAAASSAPAPLTWPCDCRWVTHLTLNAVNDGDLVFMHRQSEWLRQAEAGGHKGQSYFMPSQSDRCAPDPAWLPRVVCLCYLCSVTNSLTTNRPPVVSALPDLSESSKHCQTGAGATAWAQLWCTCTLCAGLSLCQGTEALQLPSTGRHAADPLPILT